MRFGQKNRFRVITPNNSMSTYNTPPRPAPAAISVPNIPPPIPANPAPVGTSPRTSFFSSLLSVVPMASPLRTSFARPSFASPAPPPVPVPDPADEVIDEEEAAQEDEKGEAEEGNIEQSWEVPGEEGEVSLLGSSTGDMTRESALYDEDEEGEEGEDEGLEMPHAPWSGQPEVHSSPLALPSATGDSSKDISMQDLAASTFSPDLAVDASIKSDRERFETHPSGGPSNSPRSSSSPLPAAATKRRSRFSSGLHVRNASTDSAALFNTRPSLLPGSGAGVGGQGEGEGEGDVSNLLSTTFEGMYTSTIGGMTTVDNSRMGMSFGSSMPGSPYPRGAIHGQDDGQGGFDGHEGWDGQEGDSSFGILPRAGDDDPTIRRRLSASGGLTARFDRPDDAAQGPTAPQTYVARGADTGKDRDKDGEDLVNPFAHTQPMRRSPVKQISPDKSASSSSASSSSMKRRQSVPDFDRSPNKLHDEGGVEQLAVQQPYISVDRQRAHSRTRSRSRSRSISPVKQSAPAPSSIFLDSPPPADGASPISGTADEGHAREVLATTLQAAKTPSPNTSLFSAPTPPSNETKFRSIFADMSAEQAQVQWPLQASTRLRPLVAAASSSVASPAGGDPSLEHEGESSTPDAASKPKSFTGQASESEGSMSFSPLMIKSIRNGTDVGNPTLPDRSTLLSAASSSKQARTPARLLHQTPGSATQIGSVGTGDMTTFFTPSSTPCPPRATVPLAPPPSAVPPGPAREAASYSSLADINALLASINLSGPSIALVQAQTSHSTALEQQVDLFRTLAQRLAEEVEERDRALAGAKVKLVQSEMRALAASTRSRGSSSEDTDQEAVGRSAKLKPSLSDVDADRGIQDELRQLRAEMEAQVENDRAQAKLQEDAAREREITLHAELQDMRSRLAVAEHEFRQSQAIRESTPGAQEQRHAAATAAAASETALRAADDRIRDLEIRLRMSSEDVERERRERQRGMDRTDALEALVEEVKAQVGDWKDRAEAGEVELGDARDKLDSARADAEAMEGRLQKLADEVKEAEQGKRRAEEERGRERVAHDDLERIANEVCRIQRCLLHQSKCAGVELISIAQGRVTS